MPQVITSGDWRTVESMDGYRVERLSDTLVERADWRPGAPEITIGDVVINPPGAIWFRFWLLPSDRVVEKYFDATGALLGMRVPVCTPVEADGNLLTTVDLELALWLGPEAQVIVINEDRYEAAVAAGVVTPAEAEYAEQAIRELTLNVAKQEFPPALIRNFALDLG